MIGSASTPSALNAENIPRNLQSSRTFDFASTGSHSVRQRIPTRMSLMAVRVGLSWLGRRNQAPRVPRDLEDDERDHEADEGICSWESKRDERRARDDSE